MAKQAGVIKIRGAIDELTFVKTEDGYLVRKKSSLTKARVLKDKAFAGSRRASEEFGSAATAGKLLRTAIRMGLQNKGDSKLQSRMLKKMSDILKTDSVNRAGKRVPLKGDLQMLTDFEFNIKNELGDTLAAKYAASIDRAAGEAIIEFPEFNPRKDLRTPETASHFKVLSVAASLDFTKKKYVLATAESDYFDARSGVAGPFGLIQQFPPTSPLPVFLALGIRFYTLVNGTFDLLFDNNLNAVRIVAVDQPVA